MVAGKPPLRRPGAAGERRRRTDRPRPLSGAGRRLRRLSYRQRRGAVGRGYPLETPFGTIYGSNLTPSADHGIGRWTKDDFFLALTQGVAPGGRHLYPAMPYTSYKGMSRQDADDIYAYLMTRPAVDVAIPANEMPFPFNQRMALIGWNLLFRSQDPLPASSQGSSPQWQRGRYLADVLGHCGECHTPRRAGADGSR